MPGTQRPAANHSVKTRLIRVDILESGSFRPHNLPGAFGGERQSLCMDLVGELVAHHARLLQPCPDRDNALASAEDYGNTITSFRAAVRALGDIEAEIADGLRSLLIDRDWRRIDLWLNAADECPSAGLVGPLCNLLAVRDRYIQHEWIAEILGDIGSAQGIKALTEACSFDVKGDPFRSLAKRCLDALTAIGTPEAMMAVRSQLSSPWLEVREYVAELLTKEE